MIRDSRQYDSGTVKGLRDGLKGLGYLEGTNILIEVRNARGDRRILKSGAVELIGKKIDLIFTTGTVATRAAMAATTEIPIVYRHPLDPVALGLVKSMIRPGGNVTGVAGLVSILAKGPQKGSEPRAGLTDPFSLVPSRFEVWDNA